ncbi:hypothetical protein T05_2070 [Trichinella murrelli]|uniref:Uncharacterized protein n=1 Tax=Trichinella murrelli TaxID=144512 RepID=A0A0V0TU95_9BILA|nr:hypothetical protein T05_2070 [Trichinella murrelli]
MIYVYRCDFSVAIFWLQFSADHWGQFTTQHRLRVYLYTKRSDPSRRADFAISAGSRCYENISSEVVVEWKFKENKTKQKDTFSD